MGPGLPARGEVQTKAQHEQQQFAQTLAAWMGLRFTAGYPVAPGIWKAMQQP
ncbi:MAG: hypothetical protein OHK0039_34580 [Bacteroidia bacterium]